jgi:hypothetical protein
VYTLYSGTVFAGSPLTPRHVVLLLQGKPSRQLARELGLTEKTGSGGIACKLKPKGCALAGG